MNETVKVINVQIQKISVRSFSASNNEIVLDIHFNDGNSHVRTATTPLLDPQILATKVVEDILCAEQDRYVDFDGEVLTEAAIVISDEQQTKLMLVNFFRTLYSKAQQLKHMKTAEGYMDCVRCLQRSELKLNG